MLWQIIKNKNKREIISWVGGGIVVIAGGVWSVFVFFHDAGKKPSPSVTINQSAPGIAVGRDATFQGAIQIGLDEKKTGQKIAEAQKPLTDQLEKLAAQVARDKGVEVAPLRAILKKLGEVGIADENIPERLDKKADELVTLQQEISRLRQGPADLSEFAQKAQQLITQGDFDSALTALSKGRTTARNLREQSSRFEAEFLAQEANLDHIRLNYNLAAEKYAEAAQLATSFDKEKQLAFLAAQARELYYQGYEYGTNDSLRASASTSRKYLSLVPPQSLNWAIAQEALGTALAVLGEREANNAELKEAVEAFRSASLVQSPSRDQFRWAETQNNLGNVLTMLGRRENDYTQFNAGIDAYRAALTVRTRDKMPIEWGMTQNNLAAALRVLGSQQLGDPRFQEAIAIYRDVLLVCTRDRAPLLWAMTQNNLGVALTHLAERESGTTSLEQAIDAYHAALLERTRERLPHEWARTQNSLALALQALGVKRDDVSLLKQASETLRMALAVYEDSNSAYYVQQTRQNLNYVESLIAARQASSSFVK